MVSIYAGFRSLSTSGLGVSLGMIVGVVVNVGTGVVVGWGVIDGVGIVVTVGEAITPPHPVETVRKSINKKFRVNSLNFIGISSFPVSSGQVSHTVDRHRTSLCHVHFNGNR